MQNQEEQVTVKSLTTPVRWSGRAGHATRTAMADLSLTECKLDSMRGADILVRSLFTAGVRHLFTVSGNHIMPVFDAVIGTGIKLIHTRQEAAAVHMADAWARMTEEPGVALVTGGPGHANAVPALYTALMAESPVVLLSGHAPQGDLGRGAFQEMQQAEMAAPVTKASWRCSSVGAIATDVARAVRVARSGRPGPVHLSVPIDTLEARANASDLSRPVEFAPQPLELDPSDAAAIVARLQGAERPIILAGPASLTHAGRQRLATLESTLGVPCIGMESPRGTYDPSLGALTEILARADFVLLLGKRLDFTLKFGEAPPFDASCRFIQIDSDVVELDRTRRAVGDRAGASARASVRDAIAALIKHRQGPPAHLRWLNEVHDAIAYRPAAWDKIRPSEPGKLHPVEVCRPLQRLLDSQPESVFVSDGGEIGQWAQACLHAPYRLINGMAGSIGSAIPLALAARLAKPNAHVVAVMGDGTFGFHLTEIDTAIRYSLPVVVVVGNDARWNAEYQIQLRNFGPDRTIGCDLRPTRYDLVTAAFGGHGEHVLEASDLSAALQRAVASGLPACINVMLEGVPAPRIGRA